MSKPATKQAVSVSESDEPWIFVADWANHRIVRMSDMQGGGWTTLGEAGEFRFPVGICVAASGTIYVSGQTHHGAVCFDDMLGRNWKDYFHPPRPEVAARPANKYAGSWICVDDAGRIYVTYDGKHRIVRIDDMRGANRIEYGSEGEGAGQFRWPAGIAVDSQGRIYVADFDNFRLVRIDDMQGRNWTALGAYGSGEFEFINPVGICLDSQGRIYVADQGNDRIVRIDDMQGTNWTTIGSFGTEREPGKLYAPTGVCVDRTGRIYVTQSSSNHRIVRMDDMSGANWTAFGSGGSGFGQFSSPMGIFVR